MKDADELALAALLVGTRIEMPPEIQRTSASLALALPTATDIRRIFREEIALWIAQHDGRQPAGDPEGFVGDAASLHESHALKQDLATDPVLAD